MPVFLSSWHRQPWKISFPRWTLPSSPSSFFLPSTSTFVFPSCYLLLLLVVVVFVAPLPPPARPGLSLLQIGLVVLRVHQDNSGLALCFFQENAVSLSLSLFLFLSVRRWNAPEGRQRSARNGEDIVRRCACFMFCPFRDPNQQL